jgi:hypothetical protein
MIRRWAFLACLALEACAPIAPAPALVDLLTQPAEKTLLTGLRAYVLVRDRAAAHKYLAFIYCTSNRLTECEAEFRAARLADPAFTLSKSEAGHPGWGQVYIRVRP